MEAETITLRVFAQAKTWQADTTAVFTALLSDGRQFSADAQGENGTFVAEGWIVPMDQEIALSVAFTTGEVSSTDQLETLYDCLPENFQWTVWARFSDVSRSHDGKQVTMEGLNLSIFPSGNSNIVWPASYPPPPAPVAVDLCLYRNQEQTPVDTVSVPEALELWCEVGSVDMTNFTGYGFTYSLDPGDTMVAALRITDEYGDTSWTVMNAYGADQNGVLQELDSHGDWNEYIWQPGNTIPNR